MLLIFVPFLTDPFQTPDNENPAQPSARAESAISSRSLEMTRLGEKAADIIGLYLKQPVHAAVFCEKSAIQALDRLDTILLIWSVLSNIGNFLVSTVISMQSPDPNQLC
jgi:hypothetical protein